VDDKDKAMAVAFGSFLSNLAGMNIVWIFLTFANSYSVNEFSSSLHFA